MKRIFPLVILLFVINNFCFYKLAISWEGKPTHKDITEYAAQNSILNKEKGDYLKNLGFNKGLEEKFNWIKDKDVTYWLQEGSELEDEGSFLQVITCQGRFMNHFHNPLTNKDGGQWGEWKDGGLDDYIFDPTPLIHVTGYSSLLWAQNGYKQSSWTGGDWSWQEARDRYYLALTSNTNDERQENFARTFRALGHQMHLVQDMAVPAHVRNDAHLQIRRKS